MNIFQKIKLCILAKDYKRKIIFNFLEKIKNND